jgi:putative ABC transport system substrate-binding protein
MKRVCFFTLAILIFAAVDFGHAQQAAKVWKIGVLVSSTKSINAPREQGLKEGLRALGYEEGKNIVLEYRFAEGKFERLPELAAELVRMNVDVIVAGGTRVTVAAREATRTIPIVVEGVGSLREAGLISTHSNPGGNVTGVSRISPDFFGKRLSLLKEAVPKAFRVAALFTSENPSYEARVKEMDLGVRALGMKLQPLAVKGVNDLDGAFKAAAKEQADTLLVMPDALFHSFPARVVDLATKNKLPAMYDRVDFVEAGGLMSYGVSLPDLSRQAAWYVVQIIKGAKPSDLSLVEPIQSKFTVNLKAAQQIGLKLPSPLVMKADQVIK